MSSSFNLFTIWLCILCAPSFMSEVSKIFTNCMFHSDYQIFAVNLIVAHLIIPWFKLLIQGIVAELSKVLVLGLDYWTSNGNLWRIFELCWNHFSMLCLNHKSCVRCRASLFKCVLIVMYYFLFTILRIYSVYILCIILSNVIF